MMLLVAATGCSSGEAAATEDDTHGARIAAERENGMALKDLTPEETAVIVDKGTERPFTGEYYEHKDSGTYTCKQCGAALYRSSDKFDSGCGWPSFDDEIPGAVKRITDADGRRTEILCAACGGHLGHVFDGEQLTDKNVRHCVNSISLAFVPEGEGEAAGGEDAQVDAAAGDARAVASAGDPNSSPELKKAYVAGGCFWGVEHLLQDVDGVSTVRSGYMGGTTENPAYHDVTSGETGHAETVEVVFDPSRTSFEELARLFFEIHDPTQVDRQGPDRGSQYRSAVFYADDEQKEVTEKLVGILKEKGYDVATEVTRAGAFWPAEDYHQDYYEKTGKRPYCHARQKRF